MSLSRSLSSHILFRNVVMVVRTSSWWQENNNNNSIYWYFKAALINTSYIPLEIEKALDPCNWDFGKYRIESSKPLVYFTFLKIQRSTYKSTFSLFLPRSFHLYSRMQVLPSNSLHWINHLVEIQETVGQDHCFHHHLQSSHYAKGVMI